MKNLSPNDKLAAGRLMAAEAMPYFSAALHALTVVKVPTGSLNTFGVTPSGLLCVDDAALEVWKVDGVAAALIHEALHIVRDHAGRAEKLGITEFSEQRVWNIAADCVAAGTMITMADGTTRPIETLQQGDRLVGVQGGELVEGEVIAVLARPRGGLGVELVSDNGVLHSTPEHRVLTEDGYVRVDRAIACEAPKVFCLRDGIHSRALPRNDDRRNGKGARSALPERSVPHEIKRAVGVAAECQTTATDTTSTVDRSGNVLSRGDRRRGGHCDCRSTIQQETAQNLLSGPCGCPQHKRPIEGLDGRSGVYLPSVREYQRDPMLEDVSRGLGGVHGVRPTFALLGDQAPSGGACDRIRQTTARASSQRSPNPKDAPNIQGTSQFEYAPCEAKRANIVEGTVYYDLVTTCHSFIANGFAVHNCEINDDLEEADLKLPVDPVLPKTFGMQNGGVAEEYYRKLLEQAQTCPKCGGIAIPVAGGSGSEDGDEGSGSSQEQGQDRSQNQTKGGGSSKGKAKDKGKAKGKGKGQGKGGDGCPLCNGPQQPSVGQGWCGSGGGAPVPGEPEDGKGKGKAGDDGDTPTGRSKVELSAIRRRVAEAVQEAAEKNRGTVPGGLIRWADELIKPPKIDWRQKLAQVARYAVAFRPGAVDFRYHRMSRRQGALGYGPNLPRLPAMIQPVPHVAVAIDTSGSMSRDELQTGVEESAGILDAIGAEITFLACDAEVGAIRKVRTVQELVGSLVGGGGTDFAPVFDAIARMTPRPEVLVYVTDGCGPAPMQAPMGVTTIWLLVGQYAHTPHFLGEPFGEIIQVDDKKKAA